MTVQELREKLLMFESDLDVVLLDEEGYIHIEGPTLGTGFRSTGNTSRNVVVIAPE